MNKYRISVRYETGNSFTSEEVTDLLDPVWENLDIAKENLRRIKEHYDQYLELTEVSYKRKDVNVILKGNMDKDWFVCELKPFHIGRDHVISEDLKKKLKDDEWENRPDVYMAKYTLRLKLDNGNDYQMTTFWMGQFERLREIEIVTDDTDMKITF